MVVFCALRINFIVYIFQYGLSYCETRKLHPIHEIMTNSQNSVIFELEPAHKPYFLSQLNTFNLNTNKITYKNRLFVKQKFQP